MASFVLNIFLWKSNAVIEQWIHQVSCFCFIKFLAFVLSAPVAYKSCILCHHNGTFNNIKITSFRDLYLKGRNFFSSQRYRRYLHEQPHDHVTCILENFLQKAYPKGLQHIYFIFFSSIQGLCHSKQVWKIANNYET